MATLYRKYRPRNFEEVVGQNHIKITLAHEIETGKLAHAYLFCGPRAVGKTTLARVLAKAINCLNRKEGECEPCDKCSNCEEIKTGRGLDIIEMDAASHTGVDNVRENIIAQARVSPVRLKYKVFIIDEAHMLSVSAFNALLKIMEEPPERVMFILCTTEVHKVPNTIISRCQRFDFRRIGANEIAKKLARIAKEEKISVDKKILESIARRSEGHMRDAESLLGQIISVAGREITQEEADLVIPRSDFEEIINLIGMLARKDAASALALVNSLVEQGVDLKAFLKDLIEISRKMMLAKINPALAERLGAELGETLELKMNKVSADLTLPRIIALIEEFAKAEKEIKGSFAAQLPLELAVARLCLRSPSVVESGPSASAPAAKARFAPPPNAATDSPPRENEGGDFNRANFGDISRKWNEVLAKVKKYNHSLSFILRVCEPRQINGDKLCLAFKYKFHKERVEDSAIKAIVEKVLKEVYGAPLSIEAVIDENLEIKGASAPSQGEEEKREEEGSAPPAADGEGGDLINNLLNTFGGRVVG